MIEELLSPKRACRFQWRLCNRDDKLEGLVLQNLIAKIFRSSQLCCNPVLSSLFLDPLPESASSNPQLWKSDQHFVMSQRGRGGSTGSVVAPTSLVFVQPYKCRVQQGIRLSRIQTISGLAPGCKHSAKHPGFWIYFIINSSF